MRVGSVCSGIGGAELAFDGHDHVFGAETEAFPRAVLHHHFPGIRLYGDFTTIQADAGPVDVLVGGTPCQSFSVAGLRGGMADERGNLALEYLRLAQRLRPTWVLWENVPGVLSSNGGRDFGAFVGGLAELGYGWAYRCLDAQYFGLAQRRKRVFVVGCLGDWRRAVSVLFEPSCLRGHPPPRRETGQRAAPTLAGCSNGGGANGSGRDADTADSLIAMCLNAHGGSGRIDAESETFITHSLRADGFDAGEDGTGRGTPLVATTDTIHGVRHADAKEARPTQALRALCDAVDPQTLVGWCAGVVAPFWPQEVLRSGLHGSSLRCPPLPQRGLVNVALSCAQAGRGWTVFDLWQAGCDGCPPQGWQPSEQLARELGAYLSRLPYSPSPASRFLQAVWEAGEGSRLLREALSTLQEIRRSAVDQGQPVRATPVGAGEEPSQDVPNARMRSDGARPRPLRDARTATAQVRRLVVEECEALQGLPRGYTAVAYRGRPAADGPRYRALGNAFAVPVVRWIARRIAQEHGNA